MKSILDPTFRYVPAAKSDIRVSIRRAQRELEKEREREEANKQEAARVVKPMRKQ